MTSSGTWQFCVDRGGTFTDIVARTPDGRLFTHKLLSENPGAYADAATTGIADLLGAARGHEQPGAEILRDMRASGRQCRHAREGVSPALAASIRQGGSLKVVTTNFREGYLRKNGVPYSETATITD